MDLLTGLLTCMLDRVHRLWGLKSETRHLRILFRQRSLSQCCAVSGVLIRHSDVDMMRNHAARSSEH